MDNDHFTLLSFVYEHAENEPVSRRIQLYRALSRICGDPIEQKHFTAMADNLQKADELCRQYKFSFVQKNKAGEGE